MRDEEDAGAAQNSLGADSTDPRRALIEQLGAITGDGGVLTGEDVASRYPGFFMTRIEADAIVRPRSADEVASILALCNAAGQAVVVQGGMSGWVRATQTKAGEIVLSMERMNRVLDLDPVNRTATVEAGVILQNLDDLVGEHGLTFPSISAVAVHATSAAMHPRTPVECASSASA